jgi:hypothetical protein
LTTVTGAGCIARETIPKHYLGMALLASKDSKQSIRAR